MSYFILYQALAPWHPGEPQVPALKFKELTVFITPLLCVAAFTVVEL